MANDATARAIPFPIHLAESSELPTYPKQPWYVRFGIFIGTLMTQPANPKGWGWNPSVITLCLVVLSMAVGIAYYVGQKESELRQLKEASDNSTKTAQEALKLATYAVKDADVKSGHAEPSKSPDKKTAAKKEPKPETTE